MYFSIKVTERWVNWVLENWGTDFWRNSCLMRKLLVKTFKASLISSDSIKIIELIWKKLIGSWEWNFLQPVLFLLYIVLSTVTANNLLTKLDIVSILHWCLLVFWRKDLCEPKHDVGVRKMCWKYYTILWGGKPYHSERKAYYALLSLCYTFRGKA